MKQKQSNFNVIPDKYFGDGVAAQKLMRATT